MKSNFLHLTIIAVTLALSSLAHAEARVLQVPLKDENVYNKDLKDCYYSGEFNLGTMATVKPFQIFRQLEDGTYEEVKYAYSVSINTSKELILKVSSAKTSDAKAACAPFQEILLLN